MQRFFLSSYTIRLREIASGNLLPLGSFLPNTDFLDELNVYLTNRGTTPSHNSIEQRLLQVDQFQHTNRTFRGIVKTGEYGFESTLYDVPSSTVAHYRTVDQAEMLPFYFLAYIPSQSNVGMLILERFGQFGIRKVMLEDFKSFFESRYQGITVEINPLVPRQLASEYLSSGRLLKIRFIRLSIPSDIADHFDHGLDEEPGYAELSICAKRKGHLPLLHNVLGRLQRILNGDAEINSLMQIQSFDYDNIKIEINVRGSRKTLDLLHLDRIRPYFDISSSVIMGGDGHPTFASIDAVAEGLMNELLSTLGI